jgi:hypothetical protein
MVCRAAFLVLAFTYQCYGFELNGIKHSIFLEKHSGSVSMRARKHFHQSAYTGRLWRNFYVGMVEKFDTCSESARDSSMMGDYSGFNSFDRRKLLLQSAISIASLGLVTPGSAFGEGLAARLRSSIVLSFTCYFIRPEYFNLHPSSEREAKKRLQGRYCLRL